MEKTNKTTKLTTTQGKVIKYQEQGDLAFRVNILVIFYGLWNVLVITIKPLLLFPLNVLLTLCSITHFFLIF